jgi:hypothetical protein
VSEWREIDDFPGYLINEEGAVHTSMSGRLIRPRVNAEGFLMLGLTRDKQQYTRAVSTLVADAFLDQPRNPAYNSVIHLNGDRLDCRAMNLMRRPRWFAVKYHAMFLNDPYFVEVYIPRLRRRFSSLRSFCTTYGLIEEQAYVAMCNQEPCHPGEWIIERFEKQV